MESMNKFKVLTVIVLCMFLFVVAAIYTNTKDATQGKLEVKNQAVKEQIENNIKSEVEHQTQMDVNSTDVTNQIDFLNKRIDELSERISGQEQSAQGATALKCKIYGTMSTNGIEQVSAEVAVQEAKVNANDLVITCSF